MEPSPEVSPNSPAPRRWQPISAIDRRVLGVLAEKAKTTPDIYPMSLNAICTGCNQKSNRSPLMELEPDGVEESLDRLRAVGAVGMVEGYGRVQKYRHYLYEWLGVDKVELAVMTELLLRGEQTIGDLRGRAARMEPIADLNALRPVLDSLKAKGLIIAVTPEGRGQVVTHALCKPRELETMLAKYQGGAPSNVPDEEPSRAASSSAAMPTGSLPRATSPLPRATMPAGDLAAVLATIRREFDDLRNQVVQLQSDFADVRGEQQSLSEEVRTLKDALGG